MHLGLAKLTVDDCQHELSTELVQGEPKRLVHRPEHQQLANPSPIQLMACCLR
jgi:hypothetical protein